MHMITAHLAQTPPSEFSMSEKKIRKTPTNCHAWLHRGIVSDFIIDSTLYLHLVWVWFSNRWKRFSAINGQSVNCQHEFRHHELSLTVPEQPNKCTE